MKWFEYNLIIPHKKENEDPFFFNNNFAFTKLFKGIKYTSLWNRKKRGIKLTVIISNYNNSQYIVRNIVSLDNLLNNAEVEILLVDDCSTDGSQDLIRSMEKNYNNLYGVFFDSNSGVSTIRNFAMYNSMGRYVLFLDADDYLINIDELCSMINYAIEKDIDILNSNPKIRYSESNINDDLYIKNQYEAINVLAIDNVPRMALQDFWLHGRLIKTDLITNNCIHFPNITYSEDDKFMQDVYLASKKVGFWNKSIYVYNREPANFSLTSNLNSTLQGKINLLITRIAIMDHNTRKNSEFYNSVIGKKILARKLEFNVFVKFLENSDLNILLSDNEELQLLKVKCLQLLKRAKDNNVLKYFVKKERVQKINEVYKIK